MNNKLIKSASLCLFSCLTSIAFADSTTLPLIAPKKHLANWLPASYGRIPRYAVIGGYDGNGKPLFICRAKYEGGIQPGKIVGENCNFSYKGAEIMTPVYQVLVSKSGYSWTPGNDAFTPKDAVSGGYIDQHHLYICQGKFEGGLYPGKIENHRCHVSHAGNEVALEFYNVLVG